MNVSRKILSCLVCLSLLILSCAKTTNEEAFNNKLAVKGEQTAVSNIDLNEVMVGVFWPPYWEYVNDQQYQYLKDGYVDILQHAISYTPTQNLTILDKSHAFGFWSIVHDERVNGTDQQLAEMVAQYKNHPGLAGYYIKDEPNLNQLDAAAAIYKKILQLDPVHIPHVNLLPEIEGIDFENQYLQGWVNKVGRHDLKYLSLDAYPFNAQGTISDPYYHFLDRLRRVALANENIKTSAYLQSVGISGKYRRPNAHEMRFNVYSMLSYGVKYPVWFTYFTPQDNAWEQFTEAIIGRNGQKTDLYAPFQTLNREIHGLRGYLKRLQTDAVYHTGVVPDLAEPLPINYFLQPQNPSDNLIIAQMKDWNVPGGQNYAMIVNKSLTQTKDIVINIDHWITGMAEISKETGNPVSIDISSRKVTLHLVPGDGKLFVFTPLG